MTSLVLITSPTLISYILILIFNLNLKSLISVLLLGKKKNNFPLLFFLSLYFPGNQMK